MADLFTAERIAGWPPVPSGALAPGGPGDGPGPGSAPDAAPASTRPDPVFLVGFPRSGTTLLDTILRSHPAIEVIEEVPAIEALREVLAGMPGGAPGALATLDAAQTAALRAAYFAEIDKYRDADTVNASIAGNQLLIDKLPLNIVEAGLIQRVFPQARFLLALRHPCDCVLSCFMQDFALNDSMANFLTLADSARLYDRAMTLWTQYRAVLPLDVHSVRYEDIVGDFEPTIAGVFDFLGVPWDDAVRDYAETARQRGRIRTPSYLAVTQPLHTHARYRWERYRKQMAPVLPELLAWAERLGYAAPPEPQTDTV